MANTPRLALPYPALTDAPNGPSQVAALATALDGLRVNAHVNLLADFTFTSNGQNYTVPFDATGGFLNGSTALTTTTRLTVPKTGIYRVSAQARVTLGTPVATAQTMQLRKNSADSIASGSTVAAAWGTGTADTTLVTTRLLSLTANDYLQMFVTGLNTAILRSGNFVTFISVDFLHF